MTQSHGCNENNAIALYTFIQESTAFQEGAYRDECI